MVKKRILISGAGIAGMLCAILLDKEKYEVEVIEQAGQFQNIGFSFILWKSGFDLLISILKNKGKYLKEEEDFFKIEGFNLFGGLKLSFLKSFNAPGQAWVFERKHIMEILSKILLVQLPSNKIKFSQTIRHIEYKKANSRRALVKFRDGSSSEYDIVIIAEGLHSSSRELVAVKEKIVSEANVLRYAWFDTPTNLGRHGGLFFTESFAAVVHPPYSKNLLGFYFGKETPIEDQIRFINNVCAQVKTPEGGNSVVNLKTSDIFELKEVYLDQYHSKNVVFVGDAAHGRKPTLGFGAALAIEDAVFLCSKINGLSNITSEILARTFDLYSQVRLKRINRVYSFQKLFQIFHTKNNLKLNILSILVRLFLGKFLEYRIKKLADG